MNQETVRERKLRLSRKRQQRWRARQSEEAKKRLRREALERTSQRRQQETVEDLLARRRADAQAHRQKRLQETEEQSQARRAADVESHRRIREKETEERLQARRAADAEAHRRRREQETEDKSQTRRVADVESHRRARGQKIEGRSQVQRAANAEADLKARKNQRRVICKEVHNFDEYQVDVHNNCGTLAVIYPGNTTLCDSLEEEMCDENIETIEINSVYIKEENRNDLTNAALCDVLEVEMCDESTKTIEINSVYIKEENRDDLISEDSNDGTKEVIDCYFQRNQCEDPLANEINVEPSHCESLIKNEDENTLDECNRDFNGAYNTGQFKATDMTHGGENLLEQMLNGD